MDMKKVSVYEEDEYKSRWWMWLKMMNLSKRDETGLKR